MSTLQVATIQTNTPAGVLAIRDSTDALTSIQPSALRGTAANTAPLFQDSAGTPIGTLCRAWVVISPVNAPVIAGGFNVSSITYLSTGNWRVNFTTPLPTSSYVGFVTMDGNYNVTTGMYGVSTANVSIYVKVNANGNGYNPGALYVAFFA